MVSLFRKLPSRDVSQHIIVDGSHWVVDKEYCQLGEREGWLIQHRSKQLPDGSWIYYYIYPDSPDEEE